DYLKKMGVTCLYLNPIFEAHTSHRYDTADYTEIDPLLGTEADFAALCKAARQCGIRVLLDGVFSHTGADSVYFNKNGRYDSLGAYQSTASPYAPWYQFQAWPDSYAAWWGFPTLPEVNEMEPSYLDFITGEGGVARRWLAAGASGWRLDVADELPDAFIETLRKAVKAEKPDALLLGEVWEDASDKISYGERRRYLLGGELDSVMNYPFRTAMLRFVRGEGGARELHNAVLDIAEHYPPPVLRLLMNPLSTHDTPRALTALAGADATGKDKNWQAATHLSDEARARGTRLLKLAGALQYCLPGVPCLYYGDEAGLEGYADPFNRGCYPWGKEDTELMDWFCKLGALRLALRGNAGDVLREGDYVPLETDGRTVGGGDGGGNDIAVFIRIGASDSTPGGAPGGPQGGRLLCAVNRSDGERTITLPYEWENATPSLGGGFIRGRALTLPPLECAIVVL
ncbi:MAG: glycoside hydrolase family 13 protein, partial [Oscillospiraceae bacterium]|nr:glycoside hydrolase family 13 protein [Oscillospiraceae bacterium]